MKRMFVAVGLVAVGVVVLLRVGLDACGDKSLSPGGIRLQRAMAAQYPASILIYSQPSSRIAAATQELKLQQALRQVGHKYREAATMAELDAALVSGEFNIVMADVAELPALEQRIQSSRPRPAVVAVAYKLTKQEAADASKQQRFVVKVPSRTAQYLDTIADAVRSKGITHR